MAEDKTIDNGALARDGGGPGRAFYVGDWRVDPPIYRIQRGDKIVKLEPRVMQVLEFLARRSGEAVSRKELEASVWANTVVGYQALNRTVALLRKAFDDDPRNPRVIETLSKHGYRLLAPVRDADDSVEEAERTVIPSRPAMRVMILAAGAGLLALIVIASWQYTAKHMGTNNHIGDAGSAKSIAVLPFANISDDPKQEYFSDGMTDDLITDLSKISGLFVIASHSSFAYKEKTADVRQIARELGVRYVLEGSVRRDGEQVRVNAQLIDATTGRHLWAERYDGAVGDVFTLQDKVTQNIVSALEVKLPAGEHEMRKYTESLEAYDYFLRGRAHFARRSKDENAEAHNLFRKTIEVDSSFAPAYVMSAWAHAHDLVFGWSDQPERSFERAVELADKAVALDDELPQAYFVKGLIYREKKELAKALIATEKAVLLDPNYADARVLLASLLYYSGRAKEGLEMVIKAKRLNPRYPSAYQFHLGQAYFILRRYDEAIEAFSQGLLANPTSQRLHTWLAAAYAQSGQLEDAEWEANEVLMLDPDFSLQRIQEAVPLKDPAYLAQLVDGLRKAGLPD